MVGRLQKGRQLTDKDAAGKKKHDQQLSPKEVRRHGFHEFGILVSQSSQQKEEHEDEMIIEDIFAVAAEFFQLQLLPSFPDSFQVHDRSTSFVKLM